MTSGAEAADTACKLARGWGISTKKIKPADVLVLGTSDNYHGTTSGVWPLMEREAGWECQCSFPLLHEATSWLMKVIQYTEPLAAT